MMMTLLNHSRRKEGPSCQECDKEGVNRESEYTCPLCEGTFCYFHCLHWGDGGSACIYCDDTNAKQNKP